jgi:hypothetical protein
MGSLTMMDDALAQGSTQQSRGGHESNQIRVRGMVISAASLVATGIVVLAALAAVMGHFAQKEQQLGSLYPARVAIDVGEFPNPRLQENPAVDLARMRAEERLRMDAYGWVDRKAGIAHIPIERAMDILAKTGLPKVSAPAPAPGAPPRTSIPPGTKRDEAGIPPNQDRKP